MSQLLIAFLTAFAANSCIAQPRFQNERDSIKSVVIHFFNALSDLDSSEAKNSCTSDITILESGNVWNFDSLALRITTRKAKSGDFKRINKFDFFDIHVQDKIGYVSYFNYAAITYNGKTVNVKWIETAVLRKELSKWKIALLHSTELDRSP